MRWRSCFLVVPLSFVSACEQKATHADATRGADTPSAPASAPTPPSAPERLTRSAPSLVVSESGPAVRGMTAIVTRDSGAPDVQGLEKLASYLSEEQQFITGQDLEISVERQAKPEWVAVFLSALTRLSPAKITVTTSTRAEFPSKVEFVPEEKLPKLDPCTLVGTITQDRGTAIWRVSGGTARKRGRGMGGPDLSMTADTILSMKKGCESNVFITSAASGVEWGLVYDLAASAMALEKANLTRAVIPVAPVVAGNKLEL